MPKPTNEAKMLALSREIYEMSWGKLRRDPSGVPTPDLWDAQSLALKQVSSGLKAKLGSIPMVRDVRPQPTPEQVELEAARQAKSRAGCGGDCGDFMA
jgi:hypothetical protein